MWLHSLKVAQLLRSAACLHTNQSRSYLNHLVLMVMHDKNNARFKRVYIHVSTRTGSRCARCVRGLATDLPITKTFWNVVWRYLCLRLSFTGILRSNG